MKNIQRALLDAVGVLVSDYGFTSKPSGQSFLRAFPGGRASLHLAFIKHPADFDVVADVAVRFDDLEDMVNATNARLSKAEKKQTYSLGAELGNIAGTGQMRWQVTPDSDVEQVAQRIAGAFTRIGLPYLEAASTLAGAYGLLTTPGKGASLHSPIHASRAKRVVALAKLLGRHEEFESRIAENLKFLEETEDFGLQDFKRFVADVRSS